MRVARIPHGTPAGSRAVARVVFVLLLALVVAVGSNSLASAEPMLASPGHGEVLPENAAITFVASDPVGPLSVWLIVSFRPLVTDDGFLADPYWVADMATDATGHAVLPGDPSDPWPSGVFYAQVVSDYCGYGDSEGCPIAGAVSAFRVGPGPAPTHVALRYIDEDLITSPIPRQVGYRARLWFRLSIARVPANVGTDRFIALARVTGRRWGLLMMQTTDRPVLGSDGRSTVGFGATRRGTLGVTSTRSLILYRNGIPVRRRVVERDIVLSRRVDWFSGPGLPGRRQYDLQTTLLHEFGHFAGNDFHAPRCANSPMVAGLGPGEWWHARSRYFFRRCGFGASASAEGTRLRFEHRHTVERIYR